MPSKDKRKLAAIMFADVVGYSRMMAVNEEQTLELLKDFENICSPIISDNTGEIIKKVGDELFCEFSSAKQAVDCALSIQEAIQPYNDSRPKDFKLQVRIGIHVGDIVLRDGDVFGDGVNVASRIQPFANPGGICISNAVKEAISSHPNYNIKSEGQKELKNIIEKHTLYRVETGYEDEIVHVKKPTSSNKRIYLISALVILLGIIGYNGFKYYRIYSDLTSLMNKKIDLGDDKSVLFDKIFSSNTIDIAKLIMRAFPDKYKNITVSEIPDSMLIDIYNLSLSSMSWKLPKFINLLSNHRVNENYESTGELKPYYDARIENQFAVERMKRNYFAIANEQYDSSTTYIMEKAGANIGFFIFLYEVENQSSDMKYMYVIESKLVDFDKGNMSLGYTHDLTTQDRLIDDMSNWMIDQLTSLENKDVIAKIIEINQNKIIFEYCNECTTLLEEDYILVVKRYYEGTDEKLNDLLNSKLKMETLEDTTSSWYEEFYHEELSEWSLAEIDRINSGTYYANYKLNSTLPIGIKLQVTNIYDSTGVAIIYNQENPYIDLKVGDLLYIKK